MAGELRQVPLFGIGNKARSLNAIAQDRLNLYVEVNQDAETHVLTYYPTPGLLTFVDFGAFPSRGAWQIGNFNYIVNRDTLYRVANDGTTTALGTLLTDSGRVDMSDNGIQLMIVDGANGYIYRLDATAQTISTITNVGTTATMTTAEAHGLSTGMQITVSGATPVEYNGTFIVTVTGGTTLTYVMSGDPGAPAAPVGSYVIASDFTRILDPDFPGGDTVTFLNQRFIVNEPDSGRFFWSALLDGAEWDALDFATAESSPDNIVRVFAESGQLVLLGESVTEIWGDSGAADQAFVKVGGGAVEWGLASRWSLAKYMDSLAFLRINRLGQAQVCLMAGASAVPISNPQLEAEITSYGDVSNATGFSYMVNGHPFYQINFPSAMKSWMYDGQSKEWHRMESFGGLHRVQFVSKLLGSIYGADYENGKLYKIEPDVYTDDGQPIARELTTRHINTGDWSRISELWIEMESGVGLQTGQGTDPQIMLKISRDGGHTYGNEMWTSFGKVGQYTKRANWHRLGRARNWTFKFRITDPVKTVLVAAWAQMSK